ncbi:hypothetical protein LSH36_167g01016 [Paralvinella palmiformis]|uniref:EGF-like domain-containing protein n=1 Tax=Paralvinella palmiformis TaxID=53620 RepID=A0AAD9JSK5_9ANNE|nr:hypothetical protein LSH36_167g01016 [Paralvinella palmiformis]
MTSHHVVRLSLTAVILLTLLHGITSSSPERDLDPNNPNVCSYDTYKTAFTHKVVTYPCYKRQDTEPPCPSGYWQFPSGYHHFHRHPWRFRFPYWKLITNRCYHVKQILERSTMPQDCDRGDSVMADKRFDVEDIFAPYGVNIPTCFKEQPTKENIICLGSPEAQSSFGSGFSVLPPSECPEDGSPCSPLFSSVLINGLGGATSNDTVAVALWGIASKTYPCFPDNGGCDHYCTSSNGIDRICKCRPGYKLVNTTQCIDIDECAKNNGGCNHRCTNIPGSYYCTCQSGYELDFDGRTCIDIDECGTGNGGCEHNCTNTNSSYYCTCDDGFVLTEGHRCEDDNECTDPIVKNGGCSHTCNNVYGDYFCTCPDGYKLDERGFNCEKADGGAGVAVAGEPLIGHSSSGSQYVIIFVTSAVLVALIVAVLIALFCIRRRLKNRPAPPVSIIVVGKKDVDITGVSVDKEGKVGVTSSGNVYTPSPIEDDEYTSPPGYDEVMEKKMAELEEDPYEECCPSEVKDEKREAQIGSNAYVNVAFNSDHANGKPEGEHYDNVRNVLTERYDEC